MMASIRSNINRCIRFNPRQSAVLASTISRSIVTSKNSVPKSKETSENKGLNSTVPNNVEELNATKKAQFSPKRSRDTSGAQIKTMQPGAIFSGGFMSDQNSRSEVSTSQIPTDCHMGKYDCNNMVSLSSVMQSSVPTPYETSGKSECGHLGMPGGQWGQGDKYLSDDLQLNHRSSKNNKNTGITRIEVDVLNQLLLAANISKKAIPSYSGKSSQFSWLTAGPSWSPHNWSVTDKPSLKWISVPCFGQYRMLHASHINFDDKSSGGERSFLTPRQKLKQTVRDYGATVMVFHIGCALTSLGFFYLLVSSGIAMTNILETLGINMQDLERIESATKISIDSSSKEGSTENAVNLGVGVGTFVIAYAMHKVTAPLRIGLTLTATPFIVRHLRKIGLLKPPK